ncbi:hypothetical protein PVAP13_2NG582140 [Panicum virgatum]|uniref:Uncharacterized protein n=1 Tax=Panicum virgatum TaxID=38727 RepID=A0A8T0VTD2_PANVG|nr:hypothetical protein PVAP13_2NG582140 [Panicum virgatum]
MISHHLISITLSQRANVFIILPVMAWHGIGDLASISKASVCWLRLAFTRRQQRKKKKAGIRIRTDSPPDGAFGFCRGDGSRPLFRLEEDLPALALALAVWMEA